jgi:hypothetical protein
MTRVGRPPKKQAVRRMPLVGAHVSPDLKDALEAEASRRDASVADVVRDILARHFSGGGGGTDPRRIDGDGSVAAPAATRGSGRTLTIVGMLAASVLTLSATRAHATETEGFEPSVSSHPHTISSRAPSATRPRLQDRARSSRASAHVQQYRESTVSCCVLGEGVSMRGPVAGSYATCGSEPRQVRKEATVGAQRVCCRVPGDHFLIP